MESKISVFSGILTGSMASILTNNLFTALYTAALTGIAAYTGQQIAKAIHRAVKSLRSRRSK